MASFDPYPLLPWRPKPWPDEVLSSWLHRIALGNSVKLHSFCHLLWPGKQLWNRDLDTLADQSFVSGLSSLSGTNFDAGWNTSLQAFTGSVFPNVRANGVTRGLLPLGIYHRTRRGFGAQWCPQCLENDSTPYYRRNWRLSFVTSCPKHATILSDHCSQCETPAVPHKSIDHECHVCGHNRRNSATSEADPLALKMEERMVAIALGSPVMPSDFGCHHPLTYFSLVRHVASLVASNPRSASLRMTIHKHYGGDPAPPSFIADLRMFEFMITAERHRMNALVARLLAYWPFNFAALCSEAGVWWSWATRGGASTLPFSFVSVANTYLHP
ncbi:Zn ribbon nucleic-acid-binding protein [Sphingomonas trueperi]|uniref:TniQ family protein n=1 Tax=Sphingomonas trueperi TaxID=53317 RepID=UPI0033963225